MLCVNINRKLQQTNQGRTTKDPDPSVMKVCVTPKTKVPQPALVLAEGTLNT